MSLSLAFSSPLLAGQGTLLASTAFPHTLCQSRRNEVFDRVLEATQYFEPSPGLLASLSAPDRAHTRTLTVGDLEVVATRVQDNNILSLVPNAPNTLQYKGGIRMAANAGPGKARELAFEMTLKNAVVAPDDLEKSPFLAKTILMGGGKGTLAIDRWALTDDVYLALGREFVRQFYPNLSDEDGYPIDVPAPDVNTDGALMAAMMQEYSVQSGKMVFESFTGKAIPGGGIEVRAEATARGGFIVLDNLLTKLFPGRTDFQGLTVAIDGFGNAGSFMAQILTDAGAQVMAVSDSKGAITKDSNTPAAFTRDEIDDLLVKKQREKDTRTKIIDRNMERADLLAMDVDLLVLAAPDLTLTAKNADSVKAKVIIEPGNGMMDGEADAIVDAKGIHVIPDILANAGGVVTSGYEVLQNRSWRQHSSGNRRRWWDRPRVMGLLEQQMVMSAEAVWALSANHKISMRRAADLKALRTLDQAYRLYYEADSRR